MSRDGVVSGRWLSRGGRGASDGETYGTWRRAITDDHDRSARRLLARRSRFLCSGRRKMAGSVLDDRSACSARDECRVFHNSSFGRNFINLARPFTACISSVFPSTGCIVEEAQTQYAM